VACEGRDSSTRALQVTTSSACTCASGSPSTSQAAVTVTVGIDDSAVSTSATCQAGNTVSGKASQLGQQWLVLSGGDVCEQALDSGHGQAAGKYRLMS
jgi:hypothetical protein